jgi:two-component sensor histidine kinase
MDEQGLAPVGGTLVMARLLDDAAIRLLSEQLFVSVSLLPVNQLNDHDARDMALITDSQPIYLDQDAAMTVSAYTVLTDMAGNPAILLRMDADSDIRAHGMQSQRYFTLSLVLVGLIFAGVMVFVIERTVLSRLLLLGSSVLAIGTGADPTSRITLKGKDQIAYLGAAINGMLDSIARSTEQLRATERRNEAFLDAIPDVIFRVTRDGSILDARSPTKLPLLDAANNLVGRDAEQILTLYSFISPEHFDRSLAAVEAALDSGEAQMLSFHVDVESGRRYYEERFVASGDDEAIVLVREVTSLKIAEEARRKELLLKEIHHRVKNNLQVISSLLALQAGATRDPVTKELLAESRNRVRSMSLIHEKLYLTGDEQGMSFAAYVKDLAAHLRHSYIGDATGVTVKVEVEDVTLDMDFSVPCGLIITELLSNALKYAFPEGRTGTVVVGLRRAAENSLVLSVSDDGVGFPPEVDVKTPATLGLRIVTSLAAQLKGTIVLHRGAGAVMEITFPQP